MNRRFSIALSGASLLAIATTVNAYAEQPAPSPGRQVAAADTEEIIVTARRKEESLQDVPQTVTAVTAQEIQKLNLRHLEDIGAVVSGLQLNASQGVNVSAATRGVATNINSAANQQTVAAYLNDAPIQISQLFQSIFDIGQIEVLKGPQGTARGIASPSGAITITTRRPDLEHVGGNADITVNNLHDRTFQGAVGTPIVEDKLAVRLAGLVEDNDFNGVKSVHSQVAPAQHTESFRASVRFEPTDTISANVMYQHLFRHTISFLNSNQSSGPVFGSGAPGGVDPLAPAGYNGPVLSPFQRLAVADAPDNDKQKIDLVTGQIDWTLGGQKLSYVGSYQKLINTYYRPDDPGNFLPGYEPISYDLTTSHINTHELRLSSVDRIAKMFDYVVGAYHSYTEIGGFVDNGAFAFFPGAFGSPLGASNPFTVNDRFRGDTWLNIPKTEKETSFFANVTAHIGDQFEISAGTRHIISKSHTVFQVSLRPPLGSSGTFVAAALPAAFCAPAGGQFGATYPGICDLPAAVALAAQGAAFGPGTFVINQDVPGQTYTPWIYDFSLSYHLNPDLMLYAHTGSSWREGPFVPGINTGTDPTLLSLAFLSPETSKSYEAGFKWSFLDRRGRLNVDYFHQTFKGFFYYSPFTINYLSPTTGALSTYNFSSNQPATINGIEADAAVDVTKEWMVAGNVSWSHGKINTSALPCNDGNFDGVPDNIPPTVAGFVGAGKNVALCRTSISPSAAADWTFNIQSEYHMPVTDSVDGFLRGLLTYTGKNPNGSQAYTAPSYMLLNLYVGVRDPNSRWELALYGKNITDTQKVLTVDAGGPTTTQTAALAAVFGPNGYSAVSLTPRREFGINVRYMFGPG